MSAAGAWLAKLVAAVGGAPTVGALVVAGLVVGGLGGAFAGGAFGRGGTTPAEGELAIYPCPDAGPVIATAGAGQRMLVTGRTADGAWLRIHFPAPGRDEAWVRASELRLEGALESVEVAACGPQALVIGSPSPTATLTVVGSFVPTPAPTPTPTPTPTATPTPTPTPTAVPTVKPTIKPTVAPTVPPTVAPTPPPPTATPAPTPPDTAPPVVAGAIASPTVVYTSGPCASLLTIDATIADNQSGVASANVTYRNVATGGQGSAPMSLVQGTALQGLWRAQLTGSTLGTLGLGSYVFTITPLDASGNSQTYRGANWAFTVEICPPR